MTKDKSLDTCPSMLTTAMPTVRPCASAAASNGVVICVLLTLVVGKGLPFQRMVAPGAKLLPLTVNNMLLFSAVTLAGESVVSAGGVLNKVKCNGFDGKASAV